jgi:PhoH-like ATPase
MARKSNKVVEATNKLYVLDTNVLMHDPSCLSRFHEHDLALPSTVLEELDKNKKGTSEANGNARDALRHIDMGMKAYGGDIDLGVPLNALFPDIDHTRVKLGRLFFPTGKSLDAALPLCINDNLIIASALEQKQSGREVILVTKDVNMRIKARIVGLDAEDYFNDTVVADTDLLPMGYRELPPDFWDKYGNDIESWIEGEHTCYRIKGPLCATFVVGEFVYLEKNNANGQKPFCAIVHEQTSRMAVLKTVIDYAHAKNAVFGITARNREQSLSLNLLMDPEKDFITLTGVAGTGKTLMTLAAALDQVLDQKTYDEIIVTRVTVPMGDDIGFLPGNEAEKMGPWMGAIDDNLEVLNASAQGAGDWGRAATNDLVRSKIKVKSMSFMRGRTFLNKFVIIDEAQNLTPKQIKALITRAGPGTKIVCLGNLAQIDTPYLSEGSSGLTYAIDRFKGWPHGGHILLQRGERSRLADFANAVL